MTIMEGKTGNTVTYGRTIVIGDESFKQEKVWFGWDAVVPEGEDPDKVLDGLRAKADALEKEERETWHIRRHERLKARY
jgi:hypothetical protein